MKKYAIRTASGNDNRYFDGKWFGNPIDRAMSFNTVTELVQECLRVTTNFRLDLKMANVVVWEQRWLIFVVA